MTNRGDTVSVSDTIIQDIAALKQSQSDLRRSFDEGNRNTQKALAVMSGRLEGMSDLLQTVARLAERQDAHGSGIDRAFSSIGAVEQHVDEVADDTKRWQTAHVAENAAVERKLSTWHGIAIGVSLTAGLIVGVIAWTGDRVVSDMRADVQQERETNKRDDERIDRLERIEAQYHDVQGL